MPGGAVQCDQNRLTIRERNISFMVLLEKISRNANVNIYVVGKQLPRSVSLNIVDKPLDDALRMLLRGYSYAVVYGAPGTGGAVVSSDLYADAGRRVTLLQAGAGAGSARSDQAVSRSVRSRPRSSVAGKAVQRRRRH
ncbi:MAG: STN domain-containing protein [Thermodesulfobacteriota bacterium]|nr:STN domain-containing protein [Thermodesulfobacteriota bacterium]